jgi:integrase/recombinase XerD
MSAGFSSPIGTEMECFLGYKRALGHPYRRGELTLRSFDRYVQEHRPPRCPVGTSLPELVYGWLARIPQRKAVTVATDLGVIRQFCLYRRRTNPRGFVPDRHWAPQSTQSAFVPYVFARSQILRLLELTRTVRNARSRGVALRSLLLLLYCTGLRLGEAVRLRTDDVDLKQRLLWVRESKGRTRVVPFRADLARELDRYQRARGPLVRRPLNAPFLIRPDGSAWPVKAASEAIRRLLRRSGFKPVAGRIGPRPYDMRHTFAVHRLTRWYASGADIHARLPLLSAYMGHIDLLGTEHYLNATPELLAIASRRFCARVALPGQSR